VSRVLSALALSLSLVSSAMAGDLSFDVFAPEPVATSLPPAASLDWGVFDPMSVAGDAVTSEMFDVFSRGKTVVIEPSKAGSNMSSKDFESTSKGASKLVPYVSKPGGYPLREKLWSGLPKDRLGAVVHLSTGDHAGVFDLKWLATLSWAELNSLHSDHHDGCVSPSAKLAKAIVPAPPKVTVAKPVQSYQYATPQACQWYWDGRRYIKSCR
jgi:hypothetical protein